MDAWFEQLETEEWIRSFAARRGVLLPVFHQFQAANQRDFKILLGVHRDHYQIALADPLFCDDLQKSPAKYFLRQSKGVCPLRRLWNAANRLGRLVRMHDGITLAQTGEYVMKFCTIQEPIKRVENVEVEWFLLATDLAKDKRDPLLCFESFRYSEKTLAQLHVRAMEKTWTTRSFTYRKKICDHGGGIPRMNSFSHVIGKIKCG